MPSSRTEMPMSKLCQFCANLDLDKGTDHHETLGDLRRSAEEGCELCSFVLLLLREDNSFAMYPDHSPFHMLLSPNNRENMVILNLYVVRAGSENTGFGLGGRRIYKSIQLSTTTDDSISVWLIQRPLFLDVSSPEFFSLLRSWIKTCDESHKLCSNLKDKDLPTRVINVGMEGDDPFLKISNGQKGEWVTLSHCWGSEQPLKTEIDTLQAHCNKLPFLELPKLFRDAVTLTRVLGYRYLWIDSLCILQNSPEDWRKESANMGYIYKASAVTIAAEAAPNSLTGIFESSNESRDSLAIYRPMATIPLRSSRRLLQGSAFCGRVLPTFEKRSGPLSSRAWTLQETLLSSRVISFAEEQVWFSCRQTFETSDATPFSPSPRPEVAKTKFPGSHKNQEEQRAYPLSRMFHEETAIEEIPRWAALDNWYNILGNFTSRRATFASDKFPAISALAREVHRYVKISYVAGLWLEDLHRGLFWRPSGLGATRTATYVAPSWSWASINFDLAQRPKHEDAFLHPKARMFTHYKAPSYLKMSEGQSHFFKIISIEVLNVDNDPFGQVTGGSMEIKAPYQDVCYCNIPHDLFDFEIEDQNNGAAQVDAHDWSQKPRELQLDIMSKLPCSERHGAVHRPFAYLLMLHQPMSQFYHALILQQALSKGVDIFERVGVARFYGSLTGRSAKNWQRRRITII